MLNLHFKILNTLKGLKYTKCNISFIKCPGPAGCGADTLFSTWVSSEGGWSLEPSSLISTSATAKPLSKALDVTAPTRHCNPPLMAKFLNLGEPCHATRVEVRGQLGCVFWYLTSGCQAQQQAHLLTKPSRWPNERTIYTEVVSVSLFTFENKN